MSSSQYRIQSHVADRNCNAPYYLGQEIEQKLFIDCETYGRTAELVSEYCQKGRQVLVQGRLRYRTWEDQHGQKRSKLSLVAERVYFLGQPKGKQPAETREPGEDD